MTSFINRPEYTRDLFIFMMSFTSLFNIVSAVIPDLTMFYELQHQSLRLLLLILMISTHFWPIVWIHYSSVATRLSLMVWEVYEGIDLSVLFWIAESLKLYIFDELFAKAFPRLSTYLLVNNKLCGKLFFISTYHVWR